jgi:hypothetical protein
MNPFSLHLTMMDTEDFEIRRLEEKLRPRPAEKPVSTGRSRQIENAGLQIAAGKYFFIFTESILITSDRVLQLIALNLSFKKVACPLSSLSSLS